MSGTVIAGSYKGNVLQKFWGRIWIKVGFWGREIVDINKTTIESYNVVNETYQKSATSAIGRGLVGSLLLGPVGMLAGLSAKSEGTHTLQLNFKDGNKSLISVDDDYYNAIVKVLF